ncbi:peptidoglycan DD-metalloendopeptidase family protein [Xanthobacter dioxanivorans]|uniref:Peptidoglycan DD-metalloendopeptidase family protein n=1 Tax=Xanthobacter dioxanivorans TaxID=2528964 RepID=A0A974PUM9_9HYPH|nr:peptidoglycan DD-metalloendopeptidase family protein [Xanthobacter dioxanivorans]
MVRATSCEEEADAGRASLQLKGRNLYHRRSAGAWRDASSAAGLGDDPPLGVDGDEEDIDRRRVSVRWFAATLLTALCGTFLMGGAVYAALDGEHRFALMPEKVRSVIRGALALGERPVNTARKGDRMSLLGDAPSARQTFRVSTATKVGDREIIKVRPFTRVSANLAMSTTSVSANIPRFNPAQIVSDSVNKEESAPQAEPTGEVTVVSRDIAGLPQNTRFGASLPMENVLVKVREVAELSRVQPGQGVPSPAIATGPLAPSAPYLAYAGTPDAVGVGLPRPVLPGAAHMPENISFVPKTSDETSGGNEWSDQTVVVKKGDTIASILADNGVSREDARAVAAAFGRGRDGAVKDGLRIRMLLQEENKGRVRPYKVSLFSDLGHEGTVALSDRDDFVSVREPSETEIAGVSEESDDDSGPGIRLYESIYETALRNEMPRSVIADIIRVYSFDVDFQRRVRPGDNFEVLFSDDPGSANDVLYAALTVNKETRRYYRFQTSDDGVVDYYDDDGKSAKKFLVRKPLAGGIMRSPFGYRRHPILGYSKLHTGVDWADSIGTPIYAAGNGTVIYATWKSGYGKHTEIQHANGYVTTYSHQSGFARGIREGITVRQGQLIGYIGTTGLSTGPHLHYEVKINGNFVDPMRIKLPRGRALDGRFLAEFRKERERIDALLNHAPVPAKVAGVASGGGKTKAASN